MVKALNVTSSTATKKDSEKIGDLVASDAKNATNTIRDKTAKKKFKCHCSSTDVAIITLVFLGFAIVIGVFIYMHILYENKDTIEESEKWKKLNYSDSANLEHRRIVLDESVTENPKLCNVPQSAKCGLPIYNPMTEMCSGRNRIIGGKHAVPHSWPWQVAIFENTDISCGGSIISENWIITAAHCYKGTLARMRIRVGIHNIDIANNSKALFTPAYMVKHSVFTSASFDSDIALIKLDRPINFTDKILPICLPPWDEDVALQKNCYVTGWGTQISISDSSHSPTLMQLCVPIYNQNTCNETFMHIGGVTKNQFCAGFKEAGKDACKGDSGGPFACQNTNVSSKHLYRLSDKNTDFAWYLTGITSWGLGCADKDRPGVYTKVSNYICWIEHVMKSNFTKSTPAIYVI